MLACTARGFAVGLGPQLQHRGNQRAQISRSSTRLRAQGGEGEGPAPDRSVENLFEEELKKRGLEGMPSASFDASDATRTGAGPRSPFEQQQQRPRGATRPPPSFRVEEEVPPQLLKSRALNSEGLEGFLPRASELLKLGGTFFLGFLPFIVAVSLAFAAIYGVFGEAFVHGGSPSSGPPPYIDPDLLLAEPTADPMIPLSP